MRGRRYSLAPATVVDYGGAVRTQVHATQPDQPCAVGRGAPARRPTPHASILQLHRWAGNRAVTGLIQRAVGWTDASTQGRAWNVDERAVGKVRRIPLEGLTEGTSAKRTDDRAQTWVWADKEHTKRRLTTEPTTIAALSPESAKGKAIVLVPDGLDATKDIEVLVFLHGFTEDTGRPFAGWRTLTRPTGKKDDERIKRLRQGVDLAQVPGVPDDAPVRDVALDQAEQQLEESGERQLVIVLPQGGLHSQFGKEGDKNFDAGPYVREIVARLQKEKRWRNAGGKLVGAAPNVTRIDMAGHSGAGATLAHMASATSPSSAITGDLVLYDSINPGEGSSFEAWAKARLDADLAVLTDPSLSDAAKLAHLQTAQKLHGYCTDAYISAYIDLDDAIAAWFRRHKAKLGKWAPCLRANFMLEYVDVDHEELMRGSKAGTTRAAGTGSILGAIKALHPSLGSSPGTCPPMPKPLSQRYKERKAEEARERDEQKAREREERRKRARGKKAPAAV
jgi:hypothetical protein